MNGIEPSVQAPYGFGAGNCRAKSEFASQRVSMDTAQLIRIVRLPDTGDTRGSSFVPPPECLEFIDSIRDMHIATILPGAVRGNHYHRQHREVVVVVHSDRWSFHWDSGPGSAIRTEECLGAGAVMLAIEPLAAHAIRNDGAAELYVIGFSNVAYDIRMPDSHRRPVV